MRTSQNSIKYPALNPERKSPCEENGVQLKFYICDSVYHMVQNCPEKSGTYYTQEVLLYQSDFGHPEQLKTLVCESLNIAVLDSGATNTTVGESWFNCYMSSLSEYEKQKIQYHPVNNTYRFGNGKLFPTYQNIDIRKILGNKEVKYKFNVKYSRSSKRYPFAFVKKVHEKSRHGASEKKCCVLNHNVRNSGNIKYITGDSIYFEEANGRC